MPAKEHLLVAEVVEEIDEAPHGLFRRIRGGGDGRIGGAVAEQLDGDNGEVLAQSVQATALISLLIEAYLFIEILATSVMVSLMREGRPGKSIIYLPILLFIAFGVYALSKALGKALIGGIV